MDKLSEEGVVDESCLEYKNPLCEGSGPDCSFSEKCPDPSMTAQICDEKIFIMPYGYNQEERAAFLKEKLINNGPLSVNITNWPHRGVEHAVSLVGFDEVDGQIAWIYKNSHGIDFEINGYGKEPFWLGQSGGPVVNPTINATIHAINYDVSCPNPITVICYHDCVTPDFNYHVHDYDKDHDGYYNWGIGPRINDHPPCFVEEEDSNDDDNRIGPFKDDYSGMPVKPIMNVTAQVGSDNPVPITNHGFFLIHNNPEIITVVISNPGNAQLNLAALLPVSIIQEGAEFFRLLDEDPQPESTICMGNESSFGVLFDTSTPDGPCMAKIRIQLASCDSDIYDYFEFAIVYGECEFKEEIYAVADYESWEGYQLMFRDVYIQDGGTLEIFGSVAMHEESDIMVDAGGQLIINGGLITGGCTNLWHGIDVWGNLGQPQTLEYQGKVSVINGGCVEYAETAIETAICSAPGRCFPSGGIVSCIDAVFKDNIIDVNFYPFQNTHPVTHEILPNFSRFTRSLFKTTNDFYTLFNFEPIAHMFMDGVGGINLKGCIFGNYSTQTTENRGKGIESYNASYYIFDACIEDYFPCPGKQASRFENLEYGIRAFNSIGFYTLTVDSVDFIHNLRGIHMRLIDNATIIKNTFDISDPEELWFGEALIGLYLDEFTMGFQIEENIFDGPLTYSQTYGIHLLNTGIEQKEIYNNRFNKLGCGIMAVGENRHANEGDGLCIKCNDFYDCGTDIYVKPEEYDGQSIITENTGIAQMQGEDGEGDPTLPAGNHFSDVTSSNYINYQGCGKIDYSYHGAGTPPEFLIPDFEGDINIIQDNEAIYSKEISCPSHLDGSISLSVEKTNLINETGLIEAYKDTLNMIVDGGDTESLNFEVITSFPEEALVIRQDLINESPYLSDTVMISAIEKEDVLPGAMVRDILIQNPQAPKSIKIMNALNQRQDTLPDYMIAEIMQGFSTYGAKELLEQELGKHTIKRDQAWKNLNLFYKNDTANTGEAIDSLITVHQNENRLSTRYDLAFIFLDLADSIYTFNTLNEIPSEFELSTQESVNHDQCMELFNVLWDIKNDSTGIDSLLIESLIDLAAADNTLYGIYANNLLIREKLLTYYEPVYMVEPFKSNPVLNQIPKLEIIKENLKLFPNPTTKYFIVQYDLTKQSSPGMLIMSDIKGKELKTMYLQDKLNQIVVPVVNYKGGIYVIRLFGGSELVDTKKITILH